MTADPSSAHAQQWQPTRQGLPEHYNVRTMRGAVVAQANSAWLSVKQSNRFRARGGSHMGFLCSCVVPQ
jgi:hypothetical protein